MITSNLIPIIALIAALQAKHFICDGPLQTKAMVLSKSNYGQAQGLLHSLLHGIGTFVVLALMGFSLKLWLGLAVLDFAVHYHIDFIKENLIKRAGLTTSDAKFWWALSADQTLHQFTYLILAFIALTA